MSHNDSSGRIDAQERRDRALVRAFWVVPVAASVGAVVLVAGHFLRFYGQPPATDPRAAAGQFGDFFGGIANPIVGLLTLVGLAVTLWLQMRQIDMGRTQLRLANEQLELSRKELELTRRELERSADSQREAAEAMKGQLEQARLTAQAQTAAAEHMLATAQYTRQAGRIQALNTVVEKLIGVRSNETDLRAEYAMALNPVPGSPVSPDRVDRTRQRALQELIRLLLMEGDISEMLPDVPEKMR